MKATVVVNAIPEILFLDTPDCIAFTEFATQRSKDTLTKVYPKKGFKIHVIPGRTENGNRPYIRYSEYLKFLETISAVETSDDNEVD